jgi:transcriptional regulator with XRE-family HTH domain
MKTDSMKTEKNDLLPKAREERGWTQEELAALLHVGVSTVRSWEGGTYPTLKLRKRTCELFGMTEEQLGLVRNNRKKTQPIPQEETKTASKAVQHIPQKETKTVSKAVQQDPNRQRMLKRVQNYWINGILDSSLYQGTFIHLRLQDCPPVVVNPWSQVAQESNLPSRALPPETRLLDMYDEAVDGGLLLLGKPGAGKTTLLLSLTRDLLERASLDEKHPMPVIFNLSAWAEKRGSLPTWLVDELQVKYQVPRKLAQQWVQQDQILPLLDGLDEVAEAHRAECVQQINVYRKDHGFVPMVVCCRATEYLTLKTRVALQKAVSIEPLSWEEIVSYIQRAGEGLQGVQVALKSDQSLREMASTPLMLHIMAQTFRVASIDDIMSVQDPQARRALIFEKYIEIVLKRRGPKNRYSSEQTKHWLSWLAKRMQEQNQSEFYIERLQPDWLAERHIPQYRLMVHRIIYGLSTTVHAGLFALFRGDSFPNQPGLFFWLGATGKGNELLGWMAAGLGPYIKGALSMTLIFAVVSVLVGVLAEMRTVYPRTKALQYTILWKGFRYGAIIGGGSGLFALLIFSHALGWKIALIRGATLALSICFYVSLLGVLIIILKFSRSKRPDDPKSNHPLLERGMDFLIFSLCGGIGFTSLYALQSGTLLNQTVLANASITSFFYGCLLTATKDLLHRDPLIKPAEMAAWSWPHMRADLIGNIQKGMVLGAVILIIITIATVSVSTSFYGIRYGLPYGIVFGTITGFITSITSILTTILAGGWESSMMTDKQQFNRPNEGIRRSLSHALFAAGIFGPVGGLASGLMSGVAFGLVGVAGWFILAMGFSIVFAALLSVHFFLQNGGIAFIEHYSLRRYLWRSKVFPLNAVSFLDYAAGCILLRKVGGGYIFAHRLLLEYFAKLEEKP